MSTTDEENVLEKLIESLVSEALRGFNMEQFKMLHDTHSMREYAAKMLPLLGEGTARIVYAMSSNKALKIALDPKGFGQNKAEVDIYTNPKIKPVVTRIFDADTVRYRWLVAEIAQPLKEGDDAAFEKATGLAFNSFRGLIKEWIADGKRAPETFIGERLKGLLKNYEWIKKDLPADDWRISDAEFVISVYQKALNSPILIGVMSLIEQGLETGDLIGNYSVIGHYGKTIDGRVVVLDYGYTSDVRDKYYS